MKDDDPFQKYLFANNVNNKQVHLELSNSDGEKKETKKDPTEHTKLNNLFEGPKKTREILPAFEGIDKIQKNENLCLEPRELKFTRDSVDSEDLKKFELVAVKAQEKIKSAKEESMLQSFSSSLNNRNKIEATCSNTGKNSKQSKLLELELLEEEKRLKRQKKKEEKLEEERKKEEEQKKRKNETFQRFLGSITTKTAERNETQKTQEKQAMHQLNNISMYSKIEEENMNQMVSEYKINSSLKNNVGFIYKKLTMEKEKMPISFLKILLSYKFSTKIPTPESKKVPNDFEDQMTYKKIFHYLIVNECIADIHTRLSKMGEAKANKDTSIPVEITNFRKNLDGFIQFTISEISKDHLRPTNDKEKFTLKNFSLSRNRLGIVTNSKHFNLDCYGVPSEKNDRIFSFLCMLITPESKEDLNSEVRALTNIEINSLDMILKMNKTNKAYFNDLEKISTHLREYSAVTNLYDTEVCSFIYNPTLIQDRSLEMIHETEREMLEPILQKLKTEYNNTQYESIREMVLRESGIVLLQGPPGTGKTTTLMGLLSAEYEYLKNISTCGDKRKILICAPSNAAINHITKRLVSEGLISVKLEHSNSSLEGTLISQNNEKTETNRIFPKILRVGIVETDDEDIISVSLDDICDKKMMELRSSTFKRNNMTTTQIKEKIISLSKEINKTKGRRDLVGWQIDEQINSFEYEIKKYESLLFDFRKEKIELKQAYNQIENKLFEDADIILSTLSSSGSEKMEKVRGFIGCLIVDEAAQSTEPNILIPLQSGVRKVLLVGDPYQLPSTTISHDSSITLFNRSLFERFLDNGVKPYFLNIQYRMAPLIRQFPSCEFYNNRLLDSENIVKRYESLNGSVQSEQLKAICQYFNRNSIFIDVQFGEEEFVFNSYRNLGECSVVEKLILNFIKRTKLAIGVITPYQSQRRYLNQQLKKQMEGEFGKELERENKQKSQQIPISSEKEEGEWEESEQNEENNIEHELQNQTINKNDKIVDKPEKIKSSLEIFQSRVMINTVDSFQGQEKDIIIVSTVRSNERNDIGFMKDERRINVALTRARHLLIVVGNGDTIGSNETWNNYLLWVESQKTYYQMNSEEDLEDVLGKIKKGTNDEKIERYRHKNFTQDLRKIDREEIGREDFGLGNGKKKVKRDQPIKQMHQKEHKEEQLEEIISNENPVILSKNEEPAENAELLLEEKNAKELEALQIEEVNRRLRELEERLKHGENNPYANLFD